MKKHSKTPTAVNLSLCVRPRMNDVTADETKWVASAEKKRKIESTRSLSRWLPSEGKRHQKISLGAVVRQTVHVRRQDTVLTRESKLYFHVSVQSWIVAGFTSKSAIIII
jgi:hypothetical protein